MRRLVDDERGTTMAELLVGLMAGMIVFAGLTTLIMVTLQTSTAVSAKVDATQRARLGLNRVVNQLHSACIAPKAPPIRSYSTGTELRFVHATGSAVSPTPTLSVVKLEGTTLTQYDYGWKEGTAPFWVFDETTPVRITQLMTRVSPIAIGKPVFSYYGSTGGAVSETALATPLSELDASRTIQVSMAFMASPATGTISEDAKPARMQGSASFRLTAVSFNKAVPSLPCQ